MTSSPSSLFADFETWRAANAPALQSGFAPGLNEQELNHFEATHGITLPSDVREMYRLHNGQVEQQQHVGPCVLPECFIFLPLSVMEDRRADLGDMFDELEGYISYPPDHPIKPQLYSAAWLTLAWDGRGVELLIDLDPAPSGTPGQIIDWDIEGGGPTFIAPSVTAWLELWISDLATATPFERGLQFTRTSISASR